MLVLLNKNDAVHIHHRTVIFQALKVLVRLMEQNVIFNFNFVALGAAKMMKDVRRIESFVNILQTEWEKLLVSTDLVKIRLV